jgi:hypothetical protein
MKIPAGLLRTPPPEHSGRLVSDHIAGRIRRWFSTWPHGNVFVDNFSPNICILDNLK